MGYWLSLLGAARAFHLVVVLPRKSLIIRLACLISD